MNIFTVNQVNQVYVAEGANAAVVEITKSGSTKTDVNKANVGSIGVGVTADGKSVYFTHVGMGGINRTDLIDKDKIEYINLTYANKMAKDLKTIKITVNSEALVSGSGATAKVIANEDYILRVKLAQVMCPSPTNEYWKFGSVHSTTGMEVKTFLKKMAISLSRSMAREDVSYFKIYLLASSTETEVTPTTTETEVTPTTTESALTGSYTAILLKEVEPDWILGLKQQKFANFTVEPSTVRDSNDTDIYWADTIDSKGVKKTGGIDPVDSIDTTNKPASAGTVENGKLMADYEYFYMGERGDQYRMKGYPNYVPTKYMVDSSQKYDTIGIHYSYIGANHSVQKSEKDITFIVKPSLTASLLSLIESKTGVTAKVSGTTSV